MEKISTFLKLSVLLTFLVINPCSRGFAEPGGKAIGFVGELKEVPGRANRLIFPLCYTIIANLTVKSDLLSRPTDSYRADRIRLKDGYAKYLSVRIYGGPTTYTFDIPIQAGVISGKWQLEGIEWGFVPKRHYVSIQERIKVALSRTEGEPGQIEWTRYQLIGDTGTIRNPYRRIFRGTVTPFEDSAEMDRAIRALNEEGVNRK